MRNLTGPLRWSSEGQFGDLPLVSIAIGPDFAKGEVRGHARGVLAIGDIATGWLAIGGLARGLVAVGGLATGLVSLGGLSVGLLALGGAAVGGVALGGAAFGKHVIAGWQKDPEAVRFFGQYVPWLNR